MTQNTHSDEVMIIRPTDCYLCPFNDVQNYCKLLSRFTMFKGVPKDCPIVDVKYIRIIEDDRKL